MWDINLKITNEQNKQTETHRHGLQTSGQQRVGERKGGRWDKKGQIWGDRKKSIYRRGTHNAIYTCLTVKLYT